MTIAQRLLLNLEQWNGNTFYGIGQIMKRYAKIPLILPLNCRIQHGIKFFYLYNDIDAVKEHASFYISGDPTCLFWVHNDKNTNFFRKNGVSNVISMGSPVIYMDSYLDVLKRRNKPKGTIAFPCKSTHGINIKMDYTEYSKMLANLPDRFKPIKVCMYYLDIENGKHQAFIDKGFDVVSNGSLQSQDFLYKFFLNSMSCEYATSNDPLSSATYYCIYAGLKYFYYGPEMTFSTEKELLGHSQYAAERLKAKDFCPYQFPIEDCDNYERQLKIANFELGLASKKSLKQIRTLILKSINRSFLKRYLSKILSRHFIKQLFTDPL